MCSYGAVNRHAIVVFDEQSYPDGAVLDETSDSACLLRQQVLDSGALAAVGTGDNFLDMSRHWNNHDQISEFELRVAIADTFANMLQLMNDLVQHERTKEKLIIEAANLIGEPRDVVAAAVRDDTQIVLDRIDASDATLLQRISDAQTAIDASISALSSQVDEYQSQETAALKQLQDVTAYVLGVVEENGRILREQAALLDAIFDQVQANGDAVTRVELLVEYTSQQLARLQEGMTRANARLSAPGAHGWDANGDSVAQQAEVWLLAHDQGMLDATSDQLVRTLQQNSKRKRQAGSDICTLAEQSCITCDDGLVQGKCVNDEKI